MLSLLKQLKPIMTKVQKFSESLESCTEVFQIFGLQLFTVYPNVESRFDLRSKLAKKHKTSMALMLFIIFLLFLGIAFGINLELQNQQNENVATALIVHFLSYVVIGSTLFTAVLNSYFKRVHLIEVFKNIEKVVNIFVIDFQIKFNFDQFSKNFKSTLLKAISVIVCASLLVLSFIFYHNQSHVFLWAVLSVFSDTFIVFNFSYFVFFVLVVREILISMNMILEKLKHSHEVAKISFEMNARRKSSELFATILKLKRVYSILSEVVELVNNYFGVPIMMQLINLIIANISAGYKVNM